VLVGNPHTKVESQHGAYETAGRPSSPAHLVPVGVQVLAPGTSGPDNWCTTDGAAVATARTPAKMIEQRIFKY
jgi:hypothetical protein